MATEQTQPVSSSFSPLGDVLVIPKSAYRPIKKCLYCNSIYINDINCEACGRSLVYDPVGIPFGGKSYFAIKERYVESFPLVLRYFPNFEDKNSEAGKSYVRKLKKRLFDLLDYFTYREYFYDDKSLEERKIFFTECKFIIDELIAYNEAPKTMQLLIEKKSHGIILEELTYYIELEEKAHQEMKMKKKNLFIGNFLMASIVMATIILAAIKFYPV